MNREEAKEVLSILRKADLEGEQPDEIRIALSMADSDQELKEILEESLSWNASFSEKLKDFQVPDLLKERILSAEEKEQPAAPATAKRSFWLPVSVFSTAAAIVALLALAFTFSQDNSTQLESIASLDLPEPIQSIHFAHANAKPQKLKSEADRAGLGAFFASSNARLPQSIPDSFDWNEAFACDVIESPSGNVSLVCFKKEDKTFHLYTLPKPQKTKDLSIQEASIHRVNGECCASWESNEGYYVLFGDGEAESLKSVLEI